MPTKKDTFLKYKNEYFIETGSLIGDGIQNALDSGFDNIISIELSDKYFQICKNRFKDNNKVTIVKGDSFRVLPKIIESIEKPITFWLDGHHSGGDTALGEYHAPLMQELDVIKQHNINTHTILIDDMRCWEKPNEVHGFYNVDIIKNIKEINPNYNISYEDGFQADDILVAHV